MADPVKNVEKHPWPVIISHALVGSEILNILQRQEKLKIRVSKGTLENTCIFPMSGVAFMVADLATTQSVGDTEEDLPLGDCIDKFVELHHNSYLVCQRHNKNQQTKEKFTSIQSRYIGTRLHLIPTRSANETVQCMDTIVKVTCKPFSTVVYSRLEKMAQAFRNRETFIESLQTIGLDKHESLLLQDGLGSLASIASSNESDLLDCCLDYKTVRQMLSVLNDGK